MSKRGPAYEYVYAKLVHLATDMGFDDPDDYLADDSCFSSGTCFNEGCDHTTDACEYGVDGDWCETCQANTVISGAELSNRLGIEDCLEDC